MKKAILFTGSSTLFRLLLLVVLMAGTRAVSAQSFDLRLRQTSANCATRQVVFALDIRASNAGSTFSLGSSNFRFQYNTAVLSNPTLSAQNNYASGAYAAQGLVVQTGVVTVNINHNNGSVINTPNVTTDWTTMSHLTFEVPVVSDGCYSLAWIAGPDAFAGTEVFLVTGAGGTSTDPVAEGTITNATGCAFPQPTATLSGTQSIGSGDAALLTVNYTGTGPWSIKLSDGGTFTSNNNTQTLGVSPTGTTTYTLTEVEDACGAGTVSGSAIVTVLPPPAECKPICIPVTLRIIK
ncbi:hypothetical protein GCM10027275_27360 [Rhabdobacter roseus]|uniref:Uncharacterized protein n=1 Tax=Rhabdobacter roseus TaxID=1655419 RepID=A0A840TTT8_9BACT|nr:hypothetical protein [Rhabdobacter roseus]MBB5284683.1 hypothetical protein [Rhabdobacter roseus]